MIGTTFLNRYRIDTVLGQGGMGIVYRAHDILLNRDVAIKFLNTAPLGTEGRARMLHEAQAAAQLNHPNIVSIYDAGESENKPFIIMELVEGASLHEKPPTQIKDILAIACQICEALQQAHMHSIVHRDLKPENVLITPDGRAKLMDFGLARSISSRLTSEGSIMGTVYYLAPELALGKDFDGRADLYSLGVMLYELTVGELPFIGADPLAVISQHIYAPVVPPRARNEKILPALDALIVCLLGKHPEDRPASAEDVQEALKQIETNPLESGEGIKLSSLDRVVRGRLVGREDELAEAHKVWNKARAGECNVFLVSGDPGVGKTRLVNELIAQAQVQGAYVLAGDCYAEGNAPYAPVAQIVETAASLVDLRNFPGSPGLLSLTPGLHARFPDIPSNLVLDPSVEQLRLYECLVDLCAWLSRQAPILIVLEDAHWADRDTLFTFTASWPPGLEIKYQCLNRFNLPGNGSR